MKKIGILTMPIKENYGGIIQLAALYEFLSKNGYEPYVIRKKYDESIFKRLLRFLLTHNIFYKIFDYKNLTKREKQSEKLEYFISRHFKNSTKLLYNENDYKEAIKKFDAIIVGSDQVWRYKYIGSNYKYYFLDYLPLNITKIAYAASFGVDIWEGDKETIDDVKKLLKQFKSISVRENTGVDICENIFDCDKAEHVLDPTFLPELDFYNQIIAQEKIDKKIDLFTYVLDESTFVREIINYTSNTLNLNVNSIKLTSYNSEVNPSLAEWLYHFKNAEFIVTDSFHGMVFSILFKKQFICIGNKERGYTRFKSLLKLLNLENRIVFDYSLDNMNDLINNKIDYNKVELLKAKYIKISTKFLKNSLNE